MRVAELGVRGALVRRARRSSQVVQAVFDASVWALAVPAAVIARFNLDPRSIPSVRWLRFTAIAIAVQLVFGLLNGLYRRRWGYATFEEATAAIRATVLTAVTLAIVNRYLLVPRYVPAIVPITGGFMAVVGVGGLRYAYRVLGDVQNRTRASERRRAVIFGAGEGGTQLITAMQRDQTSPYRPVALLDDDLSKRRYSIKGVRVLGTRDVLAEVVAQTGAEVLVIAVPSGGRDLIADLTERARAAGVACKVLPSLAEIVHGAAAIDIRDVTEADLLGRHQVVTDLASAASYLRGKRVLVTGAGGSIGAELCRQVLPFEPAALLLLDRDESALHAVQLSLRGRALLDDPHVLLGDIRDEATMRALFTQHRPDVVFHAAALKHLPLLERYPGEAVQSNVWGTLTVLEAAAAAGVERFVNISTDKAANPISVLGYSKRVAERLTAHFAASVDTGSYLSVRFGNVLGSRGSVLKAFHAQIAAGGPVTVTHRDVTRYFMTVDEAVQLVLQAGAIGTTGEVLVLDMGQPVRIADVARRLVAEAGGDIEIEFTGLRPGEKLVEELLAADEVDDRPVHPLITHAPVPALDPEDAMKLAPWTAEPLRLVAELARLCR